MCFFLLTFPPSLACSLENSKSIHSWVTGWSNHLDPPQNAALRHARLMRKEISHAKHTQWKHTLQMPWNAMQWMHQEKFPKRITHPSVLHNTKQQQHVKPLIFLSPLSTTKQTVHTCCKPCVGNPQLGRGLIPNLESKSKEFPSPKSQEGLADWVGICPKGSSLAQIFLAALSPNPYRDFSRQISDNKKTPQSPFPEQTL